MSSASPVSGVVALAAVVVAAAVAAPVGAGAGAVAQADASFGESVVYVDRGGEVNVTVSVSKAATVNLGGPGQGFWLQVGVEEGTTTLRVNTYKAGQSNRYSVSEMVWAVDGTTTGRQLRTESLDSLLDPAQYQMNVTVNDQERALGNFVVEKRSTDGVDVRIAPAATDVGRLNSSAAVRRASVDPDNGTVARGEWLIVHVDATGLEGAISRRQLDGDGPGVRLDFTEMGEMNVDPNEFTGASAAGLQFPHDGDGFYLFVDTADHDVEAGDRYNVSFTVPADSPLADRKEVASTTFNVVEPRVRLDYSGDALTVENETTVTGTTTLTPGTSINLTARDTDVPPIHRQRTVEVGSDYTFSTSYDFSGLEPGREFEIRLNDQDRAVPAVVAGGTEPTTTEATDETAEPEPDDATTTEPEPTDTTTESEANGTTDPANATQPATATTESDTTATTTTPEPDDTTATTAAGLTQVPVRGTDRPLTQRGERTNATTTGGGDIPVPGFDGVAGIAALVAAALLAVRRSG